MNKDLIKYALNNLWKRKRRSFLTILSIFIGIMAIFALVSFGQGLSSYVNGLGQEMGSDKLLVQPRDSFNPATSNYKFSADDLDFIRHVDGVQDAVGMMMTEATVKYDLKKRGKVTFVTSLPTGEGQELARELMTGLDVQYGRLLKKGDKAKAVIGADYAVEGRIFDKALMPGDKIFINEQKFEVIGVFESLGNPSDDSQVYITEDGFTEILGVPLEYSFIGVRSAPGVEPSDLADKVSERFRRYLGEDKGKETFRVDTFEDVIASFNSILGVINGILLLIAVVSIIVAAVNIANTMYTAVLERTNEIGIMKAIGARNSSILFIFVFEAGSLGIIGSAIGMLLGYGIAELGGAIAAGAGYSLLQPAYPWWLIVGTLLFGFLLGAVSGLAPAVQGSKQRPVEALRYE